MTGCAAEERRGSIAAVQEEIVAELAEAETVLQKYEYLVRMGRGLASPAPSLRQAEHLVPGCQSRVWIRAVHQDGRLRIEADSEALITRGIISLLLRVLDGRPPAEILDGELFFLDRTGLGPHLSPARANGLAAMLRQIRKHAEAADQR